MQNRVKAKLARGEATVGTWTMIGHPAVAEILAQAGFDWVLLDVEHGVMDWPRVLPQVQAVQGQGCAAICRVPINSPAWVSVGCSSFNLRSIKAVITDVLRA